jgi:hypothetical protein
VTAPSFNPSTLVAGQRTAGDDVASTGTPAANSSAFGASAN